LPKHQSIENAETLGFQLISALAAQLDGTIDLQHEPSPVFTLRLPKHQT
jgi:two-component sensor histidine kinase